MKSIRMVEWSFLQSAIAIFLTISGTREASIYKKMTDTHKGKHAEDADESATES